MSKIKCIEKRTIRNNLLCEKLVKSGIFRLKFLHYAITFILAKADDIQRKDIQNITNHTGNNNQTPY